MGSARAAPLFIVSRPPPCKPETKPGKSGDSTHHHEDKHCRAAEEDKRQDSEPPGNGGVSPNLCGNHHGRGCDQGVGRYT